MARKLFKKCTVHITNLSGANENMLKRRNTGKNSFAEINDILDLIAK